MDNIEIKFYNQNDDIDGDLEKVYKPDGHVSRVISGITALSKEGGSRESQSYMAVTAYDPFNFRDVIAAIHDQWSTVNRNSDRVILILDCESYDLKNGSNYADEFKDYCTKIYSLQP